MTRPDKDEAGVETKAEKGENEIADKEDVAQKTPKWKFDEDLERELDQVAFAGSGETVEGEVRGTGEWEPGEDITLHVSKPVGSPTFTETLAVPEADEPLTASKFGRLLDARGYDLEQAKHIVGDIVECTYLGDEEWEIIDPNPSQSSSVVRRGGKPMSITDHESTRDARKTTSTASSSGSRSFSSHPAMKAHRRVRSGWRSIFLGIVLIPLLKIMLDTMVTPRITATSLIPLVGTLDTVLTVIGVFLVIIGALQLAAGNILRGAAP